MKAYSAGDYVEFDMAVRRRGLDSKRGGWGYQRRKGVVTYATKKKVWIKLSDNPVEWVVCLPIEKIIEAPFRGV